MHFNKRKYFYLRVLVFIVTNKMYIVKEKYDQKLLATNLDIFVLQKLWHFPFKTEIKQTFQWHVWLQQDDWCWTYMEMLTIFSSSYFSSRNSTIYPTFASVQLSSNIFEQFCSICKLDNFFCFHHQSKDVQCAWHNLSQHTDHNICLLVKLITVSITFFLFL